MIRPCASPIPLSTLAEYWLGELDPEREAALDEHLLGCGACSAALQELTDLAGGVRALVGAGTVSAVVTEAFLERLAAEGLKLREYRVAANGSAECTVAPDDDVLVTRLQAPLAGVERLDLVLVSHVGEGPERLRDIPFDPAAGEVIFTPQVAGVRTLPAGTFRMRLLAVSPAGERLLADYTFNHTPWPGRPAS